VTGADESTGFLHLLVQGDAKDGLVVIVMTAQERVTQHKQQIRVQSAF